MPHRGATTPLLLGLALAGGVCAPGGTLAADEVLATQPGTTITLEVGNALSVARIDRDGMLSADVKIRCSGSRLSGRIGRHKLALQIETNHLTGTVGDRPVSLLAERRGQALGISGTFGTRTISLSLSLQSLEGQVGPCRYKLTFERVAYRGWVGCGGRPESVRLVVPASLAVRGDTEIAALITPLLIL